jgi:hypothetical protein
MVADAITGNISPEATTQAGNIFADATRGVCSLLFLMNFFVSLDLAPQNVDALGHWGFYISGVIVASMRFINSGCRHPRGPEAG